MLLKTYNMVITMKPHTLRWAFLLALCLSFAPNVSFAETAIAVVDVKKLLTEANAAKSLHKKLKKQREAFVDELSKKEQSLRASEQELVEKRGSLSQEEFTKKKKEFEEELLKTRGEAQKKKKELDKANAKAMGELQSELMKAVQKVADEKGYNLVLSRQDIVVADKSIDISDDALKQLNSAVSDIALDMPPK